jgi:hypothetical protein
MDCFLVPLERDKPGVGGSALLFSSHNAFIGAISSTKARGVANHPMSGAYQPYSVTGDIILTLPLVTSALFCHWL